MLVFCTFDLLDRSGKYSYVSYNAGLLKMGNWGYDLGVLNFLIKWAEVMKKFLLYCIADGLPCN